MLQSKFLAGRRTRSGTHITKILCFKHPHLALQELTLHACNIRNFIKVKITLEASSSYDKYIEKTRKFSVYMETLKSWGYFMTGVFFIFLCV